ncbi:hypothetical protein ACFP2F_05605 [Hymenobacter artigasi]|uniref:DUF5681 domain-containing protein n=1 Tax=Hymenobacter artigasi TaxID=2719616 RepID=A0ABX1HEA5_9BACT|nr:hypothetical protein [Hymenobacter artigasi]NKI88335.1 hypothetical protein [Hymenobacter artigasi]
MPYKIGTSGNPTGRPLGSANKATAAARVAIAAVLAGANAEKLAAHFDSLTGKDFIDAYVKLAEFIIPKLQCTSLTAEQERGPVKHIDGTREQRAANTRNAAKMLN